MKKKRLVLILISVLLLIALFACKTAETPDKGILSIVKTSTVGLTDTYTITYTDSTTSTFTVTNGADGIQGIQGESGADGHSPVITVGENGNWFIDGVDTFQKAQGLKGDTGKSAYEIYCQYHPEYTKTEEEWINEFLKGAENIQGLDFFLLDDGTYAVGVGTAMYLSNIVIPESFNNRTVTKIVPRAFSHCENLISITIPDSVASIGDEAFFLCIGLTSITLPNGVTRIGNYAFGNCMSLTSITVPSSVTSIGYGAFEGCNSLTYNEYQNCLYLGNEDNNYFILMKPKIYNVTTYTLNENTYFINYSAFVNCDKLTSIIIPNSVTRVGMNAFAGCSNLTSITLPKGLTSIENSVFSDCISLTNIILSNKVTSIGNDAFRNCTSLTSIIIPNSVTRVGSFAFYDCINLTIKCEAPSKPSGWSSDWNVSDRPVVWGYSEYTYSQLANGTVSVTGYVGSNKDIEIPAVINGKTVSAIAANAFKNYTALTSVSIPDSVTSIGNSAFYGCNKVTSVSLPSSITSIGESVFHACFKLTDITIPSGVTSIGNFAFYGCGSLTDITIPNSVTSIGSGAFGYCTGLTHITIPSSVISIGMNTFYECSSLVSISIPSSVTSIEQNAFYGCSSLTIHCEAPSKPSGWDSNWNASNRPVVWGY